MLRNQYENNKRVKKILKPPNKHAEIKKKILIILFHQTVGQLIYFVMKTDDNYVSSDHLRY